ncbi:hypothetical protein B0H10DRAFT_1942624 [Mycena sp. CBHHK59/15]|nr:hypothetical protein B0H10DRAFT_1942624 [Mycena sp. CBHHK59/15]
MGRIAGECSPLSTDSNSAWCKLAAAHSGSAQGLQRSRRGGEGGVQNERSREPNNAGSAGMMRIQHYLRRDLITRRGGLGGTCGIAAVCDTSPSGWRLGVDSSGGRGRAYTSGVRSRGSPRRRGSTSPEQEMALADGRSGATLVREGEGTRESIACEKGPS